MSDITLTAGVRQNLLSLQNTADLMATTQNRLATGKKVNTALDNATSFFTASSLQARSNELSALMDSMSNGIKTLEAADNGLSSITNTLESMQSTLRQARQDKTFQTTSFTYDAARTPAAGDDMEFTGGAVGATTVKVGINTSTKTTAAIVPNVIVGDNGKQFTISDGTNTTADITLATGDTADAIVAKINTATTAAGSDIVATNNGGTIELTSNSGAAITVAEGTTTGGAAVLGFGADVLAAKTVDTLVSEINANTSLAGKIRASNDSGKLRVENQSTQELTVTGATAAGAIDGLADTSTIGGNTVRADLSTQYNELRDQLDKLSDDASFNGVNLLRGDNLKLTFNETDTSTIDIQTKNGQTLNAAYLSINDIVAVDLDSDAGIDTLISGVKSALNTVRSQSSAFGSNLSIVENRKDFTKAMMNTLQTGADNLVLADGNLEAANMLALQTRQQLSSTALSLASEADQAPLRLFQ